MARYIIDIEDDAKDGLYKAKNFNTLVFDKEGLDRLEPYEELEKPEEKKPWRADAGGRYYIIDTTWKVSLFRDTQTPLDDDRYTIGNYYKTYEEAEEAAERLKVCAELRRFVVPDDEQDWDDNKYYYCPMYDMQENNLIVGTKYIFKECGLYFATEEQAQKAIDTVGADRLKRFYFGIKD